MAKKHTEEVPELDAFKAPWETDAGETEIDKSRLKRFIHNLIKDKAKALDSRDEAQDELTKVTSERDEAKNKLEKGGDPDLAKELKASRDETAKEKERADKAEHRILVHEVAAAKGLTPTQAKRLQGSTKDELEADADELITDLGIRVGDGDDDDNEPALRSAPVGTNSGDPRPPGRQVSKEPNYDEIVAGFRSNQI